MLLVGLGSLFAYCVINVSGVVPRVKVVYTVFMGSPEMLIGNKENMGKMCKE